MRTMRYFISIDPEELDGGWTWVTNGGGQIQVCYLESDDETVLIDLGEERIDIGVDYEGTILVGRELRLNDIIPWAIEHGYVDNLSEDGTTGLGR